MRDSTRITENTDLYPSMILQITNTRAYLYDYVGSIRNNQSDLHSSA